MKALRLDGRDWAKAVGVGIGVSVFTAAFMVATIKAGLSPLPKSLGLAFAETVVDEVFRYQWDCCFTLS